MKKYTNKTFNVERLLALGELDIRGIAAKDEALAADDYFGRVERFMETAPQFGEALTRVTVPEELAALKNTLEEIGCTGLAADVDGICQAVLAGHEALVQKWSPEVAEKLGKLYSSINSAYLRKRFKSEQEPQASGADTAVSLSEALEYLDYKEANRKLRILAVDDVSVVLNTVTSVLNERYEVFSLTKSSLVAGFLAHTTPELFLLDIEMPDMSGYDLVQVIRRFDEHKETPIIFLTGNASLENLKNAVAYGVCDFIAKPINPDVLLEKIESKIVRKKAF